MFKRRFIFDTDWCEDCDDCVALRFLIRNLDEDHLLLGINVNATTELSYASLKAFIEREGVDCPIALDEPKFEGLKSSYHENMAKGSPYVNADGEKSLEFYKRVLEENENVEILSVGFLNSIESVFKTYPHLIKKVKRIWIMGGKWDEQGGSEYNFNAYPVAVQASRYVVNELDVSKCYLGWEVGHDVYTGSKLSTKDMLGRALADFGCENGRPSWDPLLIMGALKDKYPTAFFREGGKEFVDENGKNYFEKSDCLRSSYLVKLYDNAYYEQIIDEVIKE